MTRMKRTLLLALGVIAIGGAAAAYAYLEGIIRAPKRRDAELTKGRLFEFGRDHVQSGELVARGSTIAFSRTPTGGFKITHPVDFPADKEALERAFDAMAAVRFASVTVDNPTPKDLDDYGLLHPSLRLSVKTERGDFELRVGPKHEMSPRYYVTTQDKNQIALVPEQFRNALDRPVSAFRDHHVFPFDPEKLTAITLHEDGAEKYSMVRTDGEWRISTPRNSAVRADANLVTMLSIGLTKRLLAEEFLTDSLAPGDANKFGLERPNYTLTVATEARTISNDIGIFEEQIGATAIAMRLGESNTVVRVPAWFRAELKPGFDELRDHTVIRFDPQEITKISIGLPNQGETIVVEKAKVGPDWTITSPRSAVARAWKISAILKRFSNLKAISFESLNPSPVELKRWFLEPADRLLVFYDASNSAVASIRIGKVKTADLYFAKGPENRADLIEGRALQLLPQQVGDLVEAGASIPSNP